MNLKSVEKDGVLCCEIDGEINLSTSPQLKKSFEKIQVLRMVINLEKVGYIDSSGLATLVELLKRMRQKGGDLCLTHLSEKVKGLFEITKLDKLFPIYPTDEMAVQRLKSS